MAEVVIVDTPEYRIYENKSAINPNAPGGWRTRRFEWKPGFEPADMVLRQRAEAALTANAAFLADPAPTNAQVVAQVQRLTRECSALIRLTVGRLETVSDT